MKRNDCKEKSESFYVFQHFLSNQTEPKTHFDFLIVPQLSNNFKEKSELC